MKYAPYQDYYIHQIAAYTIQAGEILSKEVGQTEAKFRHMFLPQWPELYTGPLKAAWYLLLDPKIEHIILIHKQSKYPTEITLFEDGEWVVSFGKRFSVLPLDLPMTRKTTKIDTEALSQLNFLSIIKEISCITILWIGVDMNLMDIAKQIKSISKSKKIWIIYYDTCSINVDRGKARATDELAMRQILRKKATNLLGTWCRLANLFVMTLSQKAEPELIGYVNTWDFGWDQKRTTSYASLIA